MPTNKFGQLPKDMICSKISKPSTELVSKINSLFEDSFYVPVYRDEERGDVTVDRPSPKILVTFEDSKSDSDASFEKNLSPFNNKLAKPSIFNQPQKKLAAYIGPISTSAVILSTNFN